jgi:hypothetical protein
VALRHQITLALPFRRSCSVYPALGRFLPGRFSGYEKSARSSAEDERFNHVPILPGAFEDGLISSATRLSALA